ncbi:Sodium:dicarboxylate symporter like protein, partial [Aduncisulcus paluster]
MTQSTNIFKRIASGSLVVQIMIGIAAGIALATVAPEAAKSISILEKGAHTNMRSIISLYLIGTFMSALVAVTMSFLMPTTLTLVATETSATPPGGIAEVLNTLLFKIVDNPVNALYSGNFI